MPLSDIGRVDHPVSLYAATKKSDELMSHAYAHLFGAPQTGLRFFTVYGPWGRPDMAYWIFTKAMLEGKPIRVFNNGDMWRYVMDAVIAVLDKSTSAEAPPHRIYNVGNNRPARLGDFIDTLENLLDVKANRQFESMQAGDVTRTYTDMTLLQRDFGFSPRTSLEVGLGKFVDWYWSEWTTGSTTRIRG